MMGDCGRDKDYGLCHDAGLLCGGLSRGLGVQHARLGVPGTEAVYEYEYEYSILPQKGRPGEPGDHTPMAHELFKYDTILVLVLYCTLTRGDHRRTVDGPSTPQIGVPLFLYLYLDTWDSACLVGVPVRVGVLGVVLGVVCVLFSAMFRPSPTTRFGLR